MDKSSFCENTKSGDGKMLNKVRDNTLIFSMGGILYGITELLWRKRTHWTMVITGGFCFLVLFRIFTRIREIGNIYKCMIGSFVITTVEFTVGYIVNIKFHMKVWDYSGMPFNILGQVCPVYSFLWGVLTFPIILVCNCVNKFLTGNGKKDIIKIT